jgi:long-subunit acyl-CoA synthetase (AMP-forming)
MPVSDHHRSQKNLIITSGGKNIAPQKIENLFLSDPLFTHFIVIGERRKFLSALLTINLDQAEPDCTKAGHRFQQSRGTARRSVFYSHHRRSCGRTQRSPGPLRDN